MEKFYCQIIYKNADAYPNLKFLYEGAHQTRRSGRLIRLGFNEVAQFLSKSEVLVAVSVFSSSPYFFHQ
jgi:hypothetical protein